MYKYNKLIMRIAIYILFIFLLVSCENTTLKRYIFEDLKEEYSPKKIKIDDFEIVNENNWYLIKFRDKNKFSRIYRKDKFTYTGISLYGLSNKENILNILPLFNDIYNKWYRIGYCDFIEKNKCEIQYLRRDGSLYKSILFVKNKNVWTQSKIIKVW